MKTPRPRISSRRFGSVLILVCFAAPAAALAADEIHFTLLGSASVAFEWRGPESSLRYGLSSAYGLQADAHAPSPLPFSSAGPYREAVLTGLQANTVYHYAIGSGPDRTFTTAPAPGSSDFTVCAEGDIGDSGSNGGVTAVQQVIGQIAPAFTLMVGDLTYGHAHGWAAIDQHFNDVMAWSLGTAYMPAWGNAEWDGAAHCSGSSSRECDLDADCPQGQSCSGAGDDLRNYKGRFRLPHAAPSPGSPALSCCGSDWYWFDYGNVRFIAYPEPWDGAIADWRPKASALMDEAQDDPAIAYIVTFGHRPAYSTGHHGGEADLKAALDALGAAHSKYVLNVNGHSHNYERTTPQNGVVHITSGTGGASLEQDGSCLYLTCQKPAWSVFRAMHQGALRLRFTAAAIEGAFVCGDPGGGVNDVSCSPGAVLDSFSIPAPLLAPPALVAPADGGAIPAATPPPQFDWLPGGGSRFQIQFSASNSPFVPQLFRKKFSPRSVFDPKPGFWRRVIALAPAGQPIYWRVAAKVRGGTVLVSDQVFSFTVGP